MSSTPSDCDRFEDIDDVFKSTGPVYVDDDSTSEAQYSSQKSERQVFTDAVHHCIFLLRQNRCLTGTKSRVLSPEAILMGHEMFERINGIQVQMDIEAEDECFADYGQLQDSEQDNTSYFAEEPEVQQTFFDVRKIKIEKVRSAFPESPVKSEGFSESPRTPPRSGPMVVNIPKDTMEDFLRHSKSLSPRFANRSDEELLPPSPVSLSGSERSSKISFKGYDRYLGRTVIPLDVKEKIVKLVRANPTWTFKMLKKETGVPFLMNMKQVREWERHIANGGTTFDKFRTVNNLTYERFVAARAKSQVITAQMIRQWALQVSKEVYGSKFKFEATRNWILNFKKIYRLRWAADTGYQVKQDKDVKKATRKSERKRNSIATNM